MVCIYIIHINKNEYLIKIHGLPVFNQTVSIIGNLYITKTLAHYKKIIYNNNIIIILISLQ